MRGLHLFNHHTWLSYSIRTPWHGLQRIRCPGEAGDGAERGKVVIGPRK